MNDIDADARFRETAESVGGMPISAGARILHVRTAEKTGRAIYVNLSGIPDAARPALVAEIRELVNHAEKSAKTTINNEAAVCSRAI